MSKFNLTKYISSVDNLKKMFPTEVVKIILNIFNPCCGFGLDIVTVKDSNGDSKKVEFPLTYNAVVYNDQNSFMQALSESFGYGYVAFLSNPYQIVVIGNAIFKNQEDGGLPIPTSIVIS